MPNASDHGFSIEGQLPGATPCCAVHKFTTTTPSGRPLCEVCGFEQEEPAIAETDAQLIDRLTEDAINAIALLVQTAIGQTDGGIAGVHFSDDENREAVREIISDYFALEMRYAAADADHDGDAERKGGL